MPQNNSQPPAQKASPPHGSHRSRLLHKSLRLILVMFGFFLLTFVISGLITGGPTGLTAIFRNLVTPGAPKLVLQVGTQTEKIAPLSPKLATELINQLLQTSATAALPNHPENNREDLLLKILTRAQYTPIQLTASQAPKAPLSFDQAPSRIKLFLHFNGRDTVSDSLDILKDYNPTADGPCYILLEAYWAPTHAWQTSRKGLYCLVINYDRPVQFELNTNELDPGELLVIYAQYLTPADKVKIQSDLPISLNFLPYGSREMIALVPLSYDLRAGNYALTLTVGETSQKVSLTIKDKEFPIQNLKVDKDITATTRNDASNAEFTQKIQPILEEQIPTLLWSGSTQLPVTGARLTTQFGARRYVNGEAISYRHSGIDLAVAKGTPIKAVNQGKVIFSEELLQTGNTIILEHGLGLKSWYYHMDERLVKVGDSVKKGDILGKVGSTGFSSGPHLHWNLSVNGTYINPSTALEAPLFREPLL